MLRDSQSCPHLQVHKIAVLDIRLVNTDRNGANILAKRCPRQASWELTPIDHGYCLPGSLQVCVCLCMRVCVYVVCNLQKG